MSTWTSLDVEECRGALQGLLESGFLSRRLADFLAYTGNAALEGRTEVDQYEIAHHVLGRSADFNALDDASVRKLATQLRHKLEEFYTGPGANAGILITLPLRSYVPRFTAKEARAAVPEAVVPVGFDPAVALISAPASPRSYRSLWFAGGLLAGLALAAISFLAMRWREASPFAATVTGRIEIRTVKGDLRGNIVDVAAGAVRTGLPVGEGEEAMLRLRFSADRPTQQSGVMAMYDADNFVRLGQHFKNRSMLEFGAETRGVYRTAESAFAFDPLGQQDIARWLSVRRHGVEYTAFVSSDGLEWRPFGTPQLLPAIAGKGPVAALYAFNGRSDNPPASAIFDGFGSAAAFHNRPEGKFESQTFPDWPVSGTCKSPVSAETKRGALEIAFPADALGCSWGLERAAPAGDWAISALVDFIAITGSSVALTVNGETRPVSLARRDLAGHTLVLERHNDEDSRVPDFPGSPPIIMRFEKRGQVLRASASRDGVSYTPIGPPVPIAEIGKPVRIGVIAYIAHWTSTESRPAARIHWIRLEPLEPSDLLSGNVPSRPGT